MLSTFEKIIETVVKEQLVQHINDNNIFIADWKCEVDNKNMILAVFVDFMRAFETIDRNLLLKKLQRYGIRCTELAWFTDYLSDRKQTTKFGSSISAPLVNELVLPHRPFYFRCSSLHQIELPKLQGESFR